MKKSLLLITLSFMFLYSNAFAENYYVFHHGSNGFNSFHASIERKATIKYVGIPNGYAKIMTDGNSVLERNVNNQWTDALIGYAYTKGALSKTTSRYTYAVLYHGSSGPTVKTYTNNPDKAHKSFRNVSNGYAKILIKNNRVIDSNVNNVWSYKTIGYWWKSHK